MAGLKAPSLPVPATAPGAACATPAFCARSWGWGGTGFSGLLRRCLGLGGNRFCLLAVGFGGLQTLFELRDALLVALFQLLNLLADGLQISIARGGCIERMN